MPNLQQLGSDNIRRGYRWRQNEASKLWFRRFYRSQFSAGAVSATLDITNFPAATLFEGAFLVLLQNFAGGGAATATFSVGTVASPIAYVNAVSVFSGAAANAPVSRSGVNPAGTGTFLQGTGNLAAAATVRLTLTADVNTNLLTTGVLEVYLSLRTVALRPSLV